MANLDTTRDFLEVIVDPQQQGLETRLDIVAVHGLNPFSSRSNAETTWTANTKDGPKFWLKDSAFLPSQIPNARIILFGYNSNPSFASSNAGLSQQAKSLLLKIRYERNDCPQRPLLFICHSLGGLLVKRALVIAHNNTIDLSTFEACYGVIFFGTPHGGGNKASLGDIASNIARVVWGKKEQNSFMEALKGNSFFAEDHRDDFLQLSNNFQFISFYEANKLKGIHQVVRREDAILNLPDMKEDKIPLDADHLHMCKFSIPDGRDYKAVWLPIKVMAENAMRQSRQTINQFFELRFSEPEHFCGRNAIIEAIHHQLSFAENSTKLYALQGPAGIGKSAIAIQYAYCFRQDYHGVFIVSAESKASLERDFQDIEMKMNIRTNKSFRQWCTESSGKTKKRWLVIIDNWEDPAVFNPREYIPQTAGGRLLITCRRKDVSSIAQIIEVPPLIEKSAISLLLNAAVGREHGNSDRHYAKKIVTALECNPLAIKQCGRFVGETKSNLAAYPSSLDELMAKIQPTLEDSCDDIFKFDREEKSVLTTWEVSFQHLEKQDEAGATLLALLGFLDPSSIHESIIEAGLRTQKRWTNNGGVADTWLEHTPDDILWLAKMCERRGLQKIMQKLSNFSLLFKRPQKGKYYMNRLTHYWLSHRQQKSRARSLRNATYLLANGYPHPDFAVKYGWNLQIQSAYISYKIHLKQLEKTYMSDQENLDKDTLQPFATIFLHDREMRIRFARKGIDFLWQGDDDHASFFELVESVVRRSGSSSLWLHAMVAYFDMHLAIQTIKGKDMYTSLAEYEYAGTNWLKVNQSLRALNSADHPQHMVYKFDELDASLQDVMRDSLAWTALAVVTDILDPIDQSTSSDLTIGLCNGYMGLFVNLLIRFWRQTLGKKMYYEVLNQRSATIETRDGVTLAKTWLESGKLTSPMLQYVSTLLYDIITEDWGNRLVVTWERVSREIAYDDPELAIIRTRVQEHEETQSLREDVSNYVSFFQSNIQPLITHLGIDNLITVRRLDSYLNILTDLCRTDFVAEFSKHLLQSIKLTSQNVYVCTFLHGNLIIGSQDWIESTLEEWVPKIAELERSAEFPRIYTNDPLLDVLEHVIRFCQRACKDEKVASWKCVYRAAAFLRYPDLTSRLCLGFGIGAFGHPYSRLRTQNYAVDEDVLDMPWPAAKINQFSAAEQTAMMKKVEDVKNIYRQSVEKAWALPTDERRSVALAQLLNHFQRSTGMINENTPQHWFSRMGTNKQEDTKARVEAGGELEGEAQEQASIFGKKLLTEILRSSNITIGELATVIRQMPVPDDAAPGITLSSDEDSVSGNNSSDDKDGDGDEDEDEDEGGGEEEEEEEEERPLRAGMPSSSACHPS